MISLSKLAVLLYHTILKEALIENSQFVICPAHYEVVVVTVKMSGKAFAHTNKGYNRVKGCFRCLPLPDDRWEPTGSSDVFSHFDRVSAMS